MTNGYGAQAVPVPGKGTILLRIPDEADLERMGDLMLAAGLKVRPDTGGCGVHVAGGEHGDAKTHPRPGDYIFFDSDAREPTLKIGPAALMVVRTTALRFLFRPSKELRPHEAVLGPRAKHFLIATDHVVSMDERVFLGCALACPCALEPLLALPQDRLAAWFPSMAAQQLVTTLVRAYECDPSLEKGIYFDVHVAIENGLPVHPSARGARQLAAELLSVRTGRPPWTPDVQTRILERARVSLALLEHEHVARKETRRVKAAEDKGDTEAVDSALRALQLVRAAQSKLRTGIPPNDITIV